MPRFIDVSPPLSGRLAGWPGDVDPSLAGELAARGVALPLRIEGGDGSPVRAVLVAP